MYSVNFPIWFKIDLGNSDHFKYNTINKDLIYGIF